METKGIPKLYNWQGETGKTKPLLWNQDRFLIDICSNDIEGPEEEFVKLN